MTKHFYYSITVIISLFIIASCTLRSPFIENDVVFQLNVTVDPAEAGSVTTASKQIIEGRIVEISASANEGWVFDSWQGDYTGSENPVTITMDSDKEILAQFVKKEYPLTITIVGEGMVTEKVVRNKTTDYPHDTTVELTANPVDGWSFSHWEGDIEESMNPVSIVMDSDKSVTAVFEQQSNDLTIHIKGEGKVTNEVILDGKLMKLTATAVSGWSFSHWEGDLSGSENPALISINSNKTVTAVFVKESFTLTVETKRKGSVSRTLLLGGESDGEYESDSVVELTATTDNDWEFTHWEGDLSGGQNPQTITIDEDKSVTAVFKKKK